jgi:hypothetical protein
MGALERVIVGALLAAAVALAPVQAQEVLRPTRFGFETPVGCLNPRERRALIESGAVLRLVAVMRMVHDSVPGILIRARLCRRPDGFTYVLTLLAYDGKVTRMAVDAVKGTLMGER